jgi:hypothetical protein
MHACSNRWCLHVHVKCLRGSLLRSTCCVMVCSYWYSFWDNVWLCLEFCKWPRHLLHRPCGCINGGGNVRGGHLQTVGPYPIRRLVAGLDVR